MTFGNFLLITNQIHYHDNSRQHCVDGLQEQYFSPFGMFAQLQTLLSLLLSSCLQLCPHFPPRFNYTRWVMTRSFYFCPPRMPCRSWASWRTRCSQCWSWWLPCWNSATSSSSLSRAATVQMKAESKTKMVGLTDNKQDLLFMTGLHLHLDDFAALCSHLYV